MRIFTFYLASKVVENPVWLAPEVLRKQKYTEKVDVYSAGVILWELMTGENYFGEVSHMFVLEDKVLSKQRPDLSLNDHNCPFPEYKSLISFSWSDDPHLRPSFSHLCSRLVDLCVKAQTLDDPCTKSTSDPSPSS
eukprot:TRINITY_DN783_c0_g1_i2.p1 TRINITY_DN783_c0_g1~~TRINITY_DN783_c0_g1_i2.p1  ORF type:complete len:136 (+),score=31.56 TRINITY_DN783_c0_g1_i2:85-492(+)